MTTGLLVTAVGRQKLIAFAAGGAAVNITHIAVGDANGVPYTPAEAQVALVNERYRMVVSSLGVTNEPAVNAEAIFPADTPDAQNRPSHGFFVHELGVFDDTGAMIAVARMGGGFKPAPINGQASSRVLIAKIFAANVQSIVASIDASIWTHIGRMHGLYFLAHAGVMNAPPVSPAVGVFHIVGPAPTGAWAGQAGKITQWTGVMWVFKDAPVGLVVNDQSISDNTNPNKWLRRNQAGTAWEQAMGTTINIGPVCFATDSEARNKTIEHKAIDPKRLNLINSGGYMQAGRSGNQSIPAGGGFTTLILNSLVTASPHLTLNTSTGIMTCQEEGIFELKGAISSAVQFPAGQKAIEIQIVRAIGGGSWSYRVANTAAVDWLIAFTVSFTLYVNDTVRVNIFSASACTIEGASTVRDWLTVTRVASI